MRTSLKKNTVLVSVEDSFWEILFLHFYVRVSLIFVHFDLVFIIVTINTWHCNKLEITRKNQVYFRTKKNYTTTSDGIRSHGIMLIINFYFNVPEIKVRKKLISCIKYWIFRNYAYTYKMDGEISIGFNLALITFEIQTWECCHRKCETSQEPNQWST